MRWALYLWPGMVALWTRGAWAGLVVAIAFAALLNVAMLGTWVWSEWLNGWQWWAAWSMVAATSAGALAYGDGPRFAGRAAPGLALDGADDLLAAAQREYLRTHWVEAEMLLRRQLVRHPADAAARLLLATLFRHTGRYDEARRELRQIESLNDGHVWSWEVERERLLLGAEATSGTSGAKLSEEDTSEERMVEHPHKDESVTAGPRIYGGEPSSATDGPSDAAGYNRQRKMDDAA
ncbi:MAG: hypothetical protein R3C10_18440 [Pirellulales bacterium]|nr:hypothetical protein [Planctomycetales bacterium]